MDAVARSHDIQRDLETAGRDREGPSLPPKPLVELSIVHQHLKPEPKASTTNSITRQGIVHKIQNAEIQMTV